MPAKLFALLPKFIFSGGIAVMVFSTLVAALSTDNPLAVLGYFICGVTAGAVVIGLGVVIENSIAAAQVRQRDSANLRAMTKANVELIEVLKEVFTPDPDADSE